MAPRSVLYVVLLDNSPDFANPSRFEVADTLLDVPAAGLVPGARYYWKVVALSGAGRQREAYFSRTFVARRSLPGDVLPSQLDRVPRIVLSPNPSRGATTLTLRGFHVANAPGHGAGLIEIFDPLGRVVRQLTVELPVGQDGSGQSWWDGKDSSGRPVPSGVYLCVVTAGGLSARTKVMVTR